MPLLGARVIEPQSCRGQAKQAKIKREKIAKQAAKQRGKHAQLHTVEINSI